MARTTDTRARVRALAEQLAASGEEPSPTVIRRMLGRGSLETVVDELRRWREDTAPIAQPSHGEPANAAPDLATPAHRPSGLAELLLPLQQAIESLNQRIADQDVRHAAETALAYERFAAVQKMAMVAIDEAREQARFWKQEAERVRLDAETRADTYRDAMRAAQAEAGRLADILERSETTRAASTHLNDVVPSPPHMAPLTAGAAAILATSGLPAPAPAPDSPAYDLDGYANE